MCRSIRTLRPVGSSGEPASDEEIAAAALQYVRKVSGYRRPSRVNQAAFEAAVGEVAESTHRLLALLAANASARPAARRRAASTGGSP